MKRTRTTVRRTDKGAALIVTLRTPSGQHAGERRLEVEPVSADTPAPANGPKPPLQ